MPLVVKGVGYQASLRALVTCPAIASVGHAETTKVGLAPPSAFRQMGHAKRHYPLNYFRIDKKCSSRSAIAEKCVNRKHYPAEGCRSGTLAPLRSLVVDAGGLGSLDQGGMSVETRHSENMRYCVGYGIYVPQSFWG